MHGLREREWNREKKKIIIDGERQKICTGAMRGELGPVDSMKWNIKMGHI